MNSKLALFLKLFCIVYLVILIPKMVSFYSDEEMVAKRKRFSSLLGVENFVYGDGGGKRLKKLNYGLICDPRSFDQDGNRSVDLLKNNGFLIKKIFVNSKKSDPGVTNVYPTENGRDVSSYIPLYFLRGDCCQFLTRNSEGIDAFLVDIQEEGIASEKMEKFFQHLLQAASAVDKEIIVLDRPTMLGDVMEGPGEIPWRHGLTTGELINYFNRYVMSAASRVTIIPLKSWRRGGALGGVIFSNELLSFLRPLNFLNPLFISYDNQRAFYMLLLAQKDKLSEWETRYLKRLCWDLGLRCIDHSCLMGETEEAFEGVRLSLKNGISQFSAFNSLLTIMRFLKNRKQITVSFKEPFDASVCSDMVKNFVSGTLSFDLLKENVEKSLISFYDKAKHCCLYKPLPKIIGPKIAKV